MKRKSLRVSLSLPPTSNNIYFNKPGEGRQLTGEARSWKKRAVTKIVRDTGLGFQDGWDPNVMYELDLYFYFEQIENKAWGEFYKRGPKKGQRKSENRWKKIDLSNRVKLVEDAVKAAVGIDDCATFEHYLSKRCSSENPRVEIFLFEIKED